MINLFVVVRVLPHIRYLSGEMEQVTYYKTCSADEPLSYRRYRLA
jgi:hypothetical protein